MKINVFHHAVLLAENLRKNMHLDAAFSCKVVFENRRQFGTKKWVKPLQVPHAMSLVDAGTFWA